jgi:uncharacterized protein (TIGR01777 family)
MDSWMMEKAAGRFLLSGASGMLGTALREALTQRKADVLQLVRRKPAGPTELLWDPTATVPISSAERLEGLTAAIHLGGANVGAQRWTPSYLREMTASRVQSTHALATALAGLRRPPSALLVASAIGIYGNRGDEILDERSNPGSGILPRLCRAWEAAAEPARQGGIRVVHLRFGVVLDPNGGAMAKMLPPFRLGLGGRLGSGKQWMSWIGLADLVAAVLFALDEPSLTGPVNLTSPQPVTNAEFTRALAGQLHRPAVLPVPAFALRLALGPMADEALLASARALPQKLSGAGFRFAQATVEEALSHFRK